MADNILRSIDKASKVIGHTWPLYSFVTSNPLSGYEQLPFIKAVENAKKELGAEVFPDAAIFRQALDNGQINKNELENLLKANGFDESPGIYLQGLEAASNTQERRALSAIDIIMSKWLASFMDEGLAEWPMPYKEEGFYKAWRKLAKYDNDINVKRTSDVPETSLEALTEVLDGISEDYYEAIFRYHLSALSGWIGYINHRNTYDSEWQKTYPISLQDYLAVRLWISSHLNIDIYPKTDNSHASEHTIMRLQYIWLSAWEKSFQRNLVEVIQNPTENTDKKELPDAQMVFCIDTRSELIRRHIESKGHYETFGYAGFFGIAMDYKDLNDGVQRKSCPPILNSAYKVEDKPQNGKDEKFETHLRKTEHLKFSKYFRKRMKNMLPSTFGYVEGSGFFYGLSMLARTFFSNKIYDFSKKYKLEHEAFCETHITSCNHSEDDLIHGISIEEQVAIVKSGFDLMGWHDFAPLIVFTGHGGHSANNPFNSSLDCGACAASPGRHNARMLAKMANNNLVRQQLIESYGISIPEQTIFVGAEHNTTTDDIVLFDSQVPKSHQKALSALKADLLKAQKTATEERLNTANGISKATKKSSDWSETRPEWGLAKNAGFIIGSRALTKNYNLDGRCFLHSYDWKKDKLGNALEGIMQGPMVVTQWINNHYYFSMVDNKKFGSGSKITHNVTGNFGVVQGNGGDLKMGLPLQSLNEADDLMYHQPLRLSVLIHAPLNRVSNIIANNTNLKSLLDNEWIYLLVMNPEDGHRVLQYESGINWKDVSSTGSSEKVILEKEDTAVLENVLA